MHRADAALLKDFSRATTKSNDGRAAMFVANFDIAPTNSFTPTCAKRLEHRFLRGPAARVMLRGRLLGRAVLNLMLRVNPANEQLAMAVDHLRDPQAFDDVGANTDNLQSHDSIQVVDEKPEDGTPREHSQGVSSLG